MRKHTSLLLGFCLILGATVALLPLAKGKTPGEKPASGEQEKKVKEAEVPKPALEALKKLAGSATITEFAEETEFGHKFYEGTWKSSTGKVDGLVTESGDLVEIEEAVPVGSVPSIVRAETEKHAGKEGVRFEKKTMVLYEMHFTQAGKAHEMILTPDGRAYHEEGANAGGNEEDDDDKD